MELLRKAYKQGLPPAKQIQVAYAELKFGEEREAKKLLNLLLMDAKIKPAVKGQARCMMAIIALQNKEIAEAKEMLESIKESGFVNSNFYATYGYMAILTEDEQYYTDVNEEAYQYNSDNMVICDNYGLCLYKKGEYERAKEIYASFIDKNPNFPEAYYNYGCVLDKLGETRQAIQMLEESLNQEFSGVTTIRQGAVEAYLQSLRNSVAKEQ